MMRPIVAPWLPRRLVSIFHMAPMNTWPQACTPPRAHEFASPQYWAPLLPSRMLVPAPKKPCPMIGVSVAYIAQMSAPPSPMPSGPFSVL